MKIGIFGGSFNPPHKMHKNIALNLIEKNYVDMVIYVPTGDLYQKDGLIDSSHRYNMLKLMTLDNDKLLVSDYEIRNTPVQTYQTLNYFRDMYNNDEIYFICGSDNLKEFSTWRNYRYILQNYKVLVIKRGSECIDDILFNYREFEKNIDVVDVLMSNTCSTIIRNLVMNLKNKNILLKDLDECVLQYIDKEGLYIN